MFTAERLEGLSEAEKLELTESLKVYTLFDSVPELVDYVFALDVFDAELCRRDCRRGRDPLERDYLRLNPLANPLRVNLRPFPPRGCLPFWCCGCHEGICGGCWGLSEAFQEGSGGPFQPSGAGWVGCGRRDHSLVWNQETGGGSHPGWSCCPEPGSESRFRISPEPGAAAWWGEISWLSDHPGGPQVFSLELSARKSQRPEPQ